MSMTTLGQRPSSREKSLLGRGESPLRHNVAEDGGGNLLLVVTLPIISRSGKSTKTEKDNESVERKGYHYHIWSLVLDTAIPLCPYNHSQHTIGTEKKRLPRSWQEPILSDESGPPQPDRKKYHDDRCSYAKT